MTTFSRNKPIHDTQALTGLAVGLMIMMAAAIFASIVVQHQFGGYDLSPLIDLGWRLRSGQFPHQDFINTLPPLLIILIQATTWGQPHWQDLTSIATLFTLLTFIAIYISTPNTDRSTTRTAYTAMILCVPTVYTNHIWHSSISQMSAILLIHSIQVSHNKPNSIYSLAFIFISAGLVATSKQNIAPTFITLTIIGSTLFKNRKALASVIVAGSIAGIMVSAQLTHQSLQGFIAIYQSAAGRATPPTEMLQDISSSFYNQCLLVITIGALAIAYKNIKNIPSATKKFMALMVMGSFVPALTDWDSKFNNIPLILFTLAYFTPIFASPQENSQPVISRITFLLGATALVLAIHGGWARDRMMNVGPFYEQSNAYTFQGGYFHGLTSGPLMFNILNALSELKPHLKEKRVFFGPRLEFGYQLTESKSPRFFPLWWHPGTSYSEKQMPAITKAFETADFDILVFFANDRTRMPIELLEKIHATHELTHILGEIHIYTKT